MSRERITLGTAVERLLAAPCLFCGYSNELYFQKGTHGQDCPWRNIGGEAERVVALPTVIGALAAALREARMERDDARELLAIVKQNCEAGYGDRWYMLDGNTHVLMTERPMQEGDLDALHRRANAHVEAWKERK